KDGVEVFFGEVVDVAERVMVARVIEQAIQSAVDSDGFLDRLFKLGALRDVAGYEVTRARPFVRQFTRQGFARFSASGTNDDLGPGIREHPGAPFANALRSAGDQ